MTPLTKPRDLYAGMNKTEQAFAVQLEAQKRTHQISEWHYEKVTFKLGDDCRYTPDFMVVRDDGLVEFYETKGFMRDDALVKLKTFAAQFPFRLILKTLEKGTWTTRVLKE